MPSPILWVADFAWGKAHFNQFFPCAVIVPSVFLFDAVAVATLQVMEFACVDIDDVGGLWLVGVEVGDVGGKGQQECDRSAYEGGHW